MRKKELPERKIGENKSKIDSSLGTKQDDFKWTGGNADNNTLLLWSLFPT